MSETERQIEEGDVAYLAGPHEPWCNFTAHDGCCHNGEDERSSCDCGVWQRKQDIAAALAEAGAKARRPFLLLAQEYEHERNSSIAARIRRAAGVGE